MSQFRLGEYSMLHCKEGWMVQDDLLYNTHKGSNPFARKVYMIPVYNGFQL